MAVTAVTVWATLISAGVIVVGSAVLLLTVLAIGRSMNRYTASNSGRVDLLAAQVEYLTQRVRVLEGRGEPEDWDELGGMSWSPEEKPDAPA